MSQAQLQQILADARSAGATAFMPFMTAGLPDPRSTVDVFVAMADSGADAFEVGIPYSDPLMDGPTIQEGSLRALDLGMTLRQGFEVVRRVVEATNKPSLIMSYANPIFRIGPDEFSRQAADAGAAGMILPDLPLEEAAPVAEAAAAHGIGLVTFAAPTTDDARLDAIAAAAPLFIYGIAEMGVTGERSSVSDRAPELAKRVRSRTDLPLVMGVGISTPDQAVAISPHTDGIIVGSALVRRALDGDDPVVDVATAVADIAAALAGGVT